MRDSFGCLYHPRSTPRSNPRGTSLKTTHRQDSHSLPFTAYQPSTLPIAKCLYLTTVRPKIPIEPSGRSYLAGKSDRPSAFEAPLKHASPPIFHQAIYDPGPPRIATTLHRYARPRMAGPETTVSGRYKPARRYVRSRGSGPCIAASLRAYVRRCTPRSRQKASRSSRRRRSPPTRVESCRLATNCRERGVLLRVA